MSQNHCITCNMGVGEQMDLCGQANGGNRQGPSSGRLSWYFAEPSITGLPYVLTANGCIVPPSGNAELEGGWRERLKSVRDHWLCKRKER
jgi:hypothetical protein